MTHGLPLSELSGSLSPTGSVPEPLVPVESSSTEAGTEELSEVDTVLSAVDDELVLSLPEVISELLSSGSELVSSGMICGVEVSELVMLVLVEAELLLDGFELDELLCGFELDELL